MKTLYRNTAVLAAIVLGLAACKDDGEKKSPSQVLARVGDAEITVHQLNFLLSQQPGPVDAQGKQLVLDRLIDQEVLVQKAVALKLDRDPSVVQAIEAAKRQILAQAAAEREIGKPAKPTDAQIEAFALANPLLFAERKRFDFDVFRVSESALTSPVEAALNSAKSAHDIAAALKSNQIVFDQTVAQKAADELPMTLLPQISAMKVGDVVAVPEAGQVMLLQLKSSVAEPRTASDAAAAIRQHLQAAQLDNLASSKIRSLRQTTQVEYLQRFATAETKPAEVPVDAKQHLEAGVKGLK
ncbi:EpsD family peptidyl-prolyl cis-trans isomerase [Jeongeupia chitinilytica]|uniref:PpiC domain-containing protein n=1 Tax=Jeongeupia chitinilytica TaxID=1041641 RepID=A0ABQ3GV50_9NEIS|nr:EpsD family peptidyl-prolyl cis-trans isomerase [Jeongeupia chitinilytica]GHD56367.1 hypothetical protein GCM10007350_03300 [Jeongeupia chitinilytica]